MAFPSFFTAHVTLKLKESLGINIYLPNIKQISALL